MRLEERDVYALGNQSNYLENTIGQISEFGSYLNKKEENCFLYITFFAS